MAAIGPKADVEDRHLNASKTVALEVGADIQPSDQIMINMSPLYMDSSVHTSKFLIRLKTRTYIRLFGGDAIS